MGTSRTAAFGKSGFGPSKDFPKQTHFLVVSINKHVGYASKKALYFTPVPNPTPSLGAHPSTITGTGLDRHRFGQL
jgi:hypothetical protein